MAAELANELLAQEVQELIAQDVARLVGGTVRRQAREQYRETRREQALEGLKRNRGNVKKTARETGIPISTLRGWRDQFGIPAFPTGADAHAAVKAHTA